MYLQTEKRVQCVLTVRKWVSYAQSIIAVMRIHMQTRMFMYVPDKVFGVHTQRDNSGQCVLTDRQECSCTCRTKCLVCTHR